MTMQKLQKVFSHETITKEYFELIQSTMEENNWTWEHVMDQHQQSPEKRIWRIISQPADTTNHGRGVHNKNTPLPDGVCVQAHPQDPPELFLMLIRYFDFF